MVCSEVRKDKDDQNIFDVIIIGGGPAGCSAALYTARFKLKTIVIDKNPNAGALGLTSRIENYPGVPGPISGLELLNIMREQAQGFGAKFVHEQVMGVDFSKDIKEVYTPDNTYSGKTVIIATGSMGRKASLKGEESLIGKGISYCATCDAFFYKEKDVAMVGNLKEILEELDVVTRFARKVYLVTSAKSLTPEEEKIIKEHPNVELSLDSRMIEALGDFTMEGIKIVNSAGEKRDLNVSGAFMFLHGNQPIVDFLYEAVEISDNGCIKVNRDDMSTSVKGVYAIGDVNCRLFRQVVLATGEGCRAALSIDRFINERKQARFQWSK